jgi:hypothetical protein
MQLRSRAAMPCPFFPHPLPQWARAQEPGRVLRHYCSAPTIRQPGRSPGRRFSASAPKRETWTTSAIPAASSWRSFGTYRSTSRAVASAQEPKVRRLTAGGRFLQTAVKVVIESVKSGLARGLHPSLYPSSRAGLGRTITDNIPLTEARYKDSPGLAKNAFSPFAALSTALAFWRATIAKVGFRAPRPRCPDFPQVARPISLARARGCRGRRPPKDPLKFRPPRPEAGFLSRVGEGPVSRIWSSWGGERRSPLRSDDAFAPLPVLRGTAMEPRGIKIFAPSG